MNATMENATRAIGVAMKEMTTTSRTKRSGVISAIRRIARDVCRTGFSPSDGLKPVLHSYAPIDFLFRLTPRLARLWTRLLDRAVDVSSGGGRPRHRRAARRAKAPGGGGA